MTKVKVFVYGRRQQQQQRQRQQRRRRGYDNSSPDFRRSELKRGFCALCCQYYTLASWRIQVMWHVMPIRGCALLLFKVILLMWYGANDCKYHRCCSTIFASVTFGPKCGAWCFFAWYKNSLSNLQKCDLTPIWKTRFLVEGENITDANTNMKHSGSIPRNARVPCET